MSFEEIMRRILPQITRNGINYIAYVNGEGNVLDNLRAVRSDYDDIRYDRYGYPVIHGGVDIYYYKMVNGTPQPVSDKPKDKPSNAFPNNAKPLVYAPVTGTVLFINRSLGQVSILDDKGYVHTIYHMSGISVIKNQTVIAGNTDIGQMAGVPNYPNHVHYEITTHLNPRARQSKIDPEAFWNDYPTGENGPFALTGSYKKGNIFYGTSNNEILKGEGVIDQDPYFIDPSDNDHLSGGGGSDIIDGCSGNDTLYGGYSDGDKSYYSIGSDRVLYEETEDADDSPDTLIGGIGSDSLDGGKGDDLLIGGTATISNGQVTYDAGLDTDVNRDTLKGGDGDDILYGGAGNDLLEGGEDDDVIFGGIGNDIIKGEGGKDILQGGEGNDTYYIDFYKLLPGTLLTY